MTSGKHASACDADGAPDTPAERSKPTTSYGQTNRGRRSNRTRPSQPNRTATPRRTQKKRYRKRFGVQSRISPHWTRHSLGHILYAQPYPRRDERGISSQLLSMPSYATTDARLIMWWVNRKLTINRAHAEQRHVQDEAATPHRGHPAGEFHPGGLAGQERASNSIRDHLHEPVQSRRNSTCQGRHKPAETCIIRAEQAHSYLGDTESMQQNRPGAHKEKGLHGVQRSRHDPDAQAG